MRRNPSSFGSSTEPLPFDDAAGSGCNPEGVGREDCVPEVVDTPTSWRNTLAAAVTDGSSASFLDDARGI
jgi:hypothetical protein